MCSINRSSPAWSSESAEDNGVTIGGMMPLAERGMS
jgi:hypothetical protein